MQKDDQAKCDILIARLGSMADAVLSGTRMSMEETTAMGWRNAMEWRNDLFEIMSNQQMAAPYIYQELDLFFNKSISDNFSIDKLQGIQRDGGDAIDYFASFFTKFEIILNAANIAFAYLDQFYTMRINEKPVKQVGYIILHKMSYDVVKADLLSIFMKSVNAHRLGEQQDKAKICSIVNFFYQIGATSPNKEMFANDFENQFIAETLKYYKNITKNKRGEEGYIDWAINKFTQECDFLKAIGLGEVWEKLHQDLISYFFEDCIPELNTMLNNKQKISPMFNIIKYNPSLLKNAASVYKRYIMNCIALEFNVLTAETGTEPAKQTAIVERAVMGKIIKFISSERSDTIPNEFGSNAIIFNACDDGLKEALKANVKSSQILCSYCDAFLLEEKVGESLMNEGNDIDNIVHVVSCLSQKDEFFLFFKASLARRLLRGKYRKEAEYAFLNRLLIVTSKAETRPFRSMVEDIDQSSAITDKFTSNSDISSNLGDLKAKVSLVRSQLWPPFTIVPLNLDVAPGLRSLTGLFETYYKGRQKNSKIDWVYTCGSAVMGVRFDGGRKELTGSVLQAVVLLLLDEAGSGGTTPRAIMEASSLPMDTVFNTIASLSMVPNAKIVQCFNPETDESIDTNLVTEESHYRIRVGFQSPKRRMDLPKGPAAKAPSINTAQLNTSRIDLARIHIVRFMKSRGTAEYSEMMDFVLPELRRRFDAQPAMVKMQLEYLLDKEYIKRNKDDPNILEYVA